VSNWRACARSSGFDKPTRPRGPGSPAPRPCSSRRGTSAAPRRTQAQILRYLQDIAPGVSLLSLLKEDDPSLQALAAREATRRVRALSKTELERLDF